MDGIDPYVVREYAQEMGRALAAAEAHLSEYSEQVSRVRQLHREVNGKCMGCPVSLHVTDGQIYADYPCDTIKAMEGNHG